MPRFLLTVLIACAMLSFSSGTAAAALVFADDAKAEEAGHSHDAGKDHAEAGHGEEHEPLVTYSEFLEQLGLAREDMTESQLAFSKEQHKAANHATGLPMNFQRDLALWTLITFVIFLFVMKKMAWQPMIEGLDQRESGIRKAIAEADENQRKSQAMLAEYEEKLRGAEQTVADMVAEAKRDAERTSQDIVAKAQADVDSMKERAKEDIAQATDSALAEVFTTVNGQVALATEHVLGRALNDGDQGRLIQEALAEIGS